VHKAVTEKFQSSSSLTVVTSFGLGRELKFLWENVCWIL